MSAVAENPVAAIKEIWDGPVIDADLHITPEDITSLYPYMPEMWQEFAHERGYGSGSWNATSLTTNFPPNGPITVRAPWKTADGTPAGSSLEHVRAAVLDPLDVEFAVATCYYGIESVRHPDYSAALAAAANDWMIAEWLELDPRLRGSITLPGHDPAAMAAEIDRVGGHPAMVQAFLPIKSEHLYGRRQYLPVFEALARNNLVGALHFGGSTEGAPTASGWPSWYAEEYGAATQLFFWQILSIIAEGVIERFPSLRFGVFEGGFLWLPSLMWRIDKEWKGLRRDVPWLKRPPSETLREHFRFSIAPADAGPAEHVATLIDQMQTDQMLLFATDYPRDHVSEVPDILRLVSEQHLSKIMNGNARGLYGS